MDENSRNRIRDLIKGGLKREEIKKELINAGYTAWDVENELNNPSVISQYS